MRKDENKTEIKHEKEAKHEQTPLLHRQGPLEARADAILAPQHTATAVLPSLGNDGPLAHIETTTRVINLSLRLFERPALLPPKERRWSARRARRQA